MSTESIAREDLMILKAYKAGQQLPGTVRLNANEAPGNPAAATGNSPLNRYPEVRPVRLQNRLSELFGVAAGNLLVTRGSSEAIDVLIRAYCRAYRDSVIVCPPTFEMYRFYADVQGIETIEVPLRTDQEFAFDADAVLARCQPQTKLVLICSPNNPTGSLVAEIDIRRIARERKNHSVVVVDEAYVEFSDRESLAARAADHDNLVVLRTLSKAHALAGARCGAVIAGSAIIDVIGRVVPPYSFPSPVIDSVLDALHPDRMRASSQMIADIVHERARVYDELRRATAIDAVWRSQANFILVRFKDIRHARKQFNERKILVREFGSDPVLERCARITIGSKDDNDALLGAISSLGEDLANG